MDCKESKRKAEAWDNQIAGMRIGFKLTAWVIGCLWIGVVTEHVFFKKSEITTIEKIIKLDTTIGLVAYEDVQITCGKQKGKLGYITQLKAFDTKSRVYVPADDKNYLVYRVCLERR